MKQLTYDEMGITVELGAGDDSTTDILKFKVPALEEEFVIENSLQYQPDGVLCYGDTLGVKPSGKPDFTLIKLPQKGTVGGVFTRNLCPSVTVKRNRECLKSGETQALAVISGNAVTFAKNDSKDLERIADILSAELDLPKEQIMISATGRIGAQLSIDAVEKGLKGCAGKLKANNLKAASESIITTDKGPKFASFQCEDLKISGICKGAGMIEPHMATMLAYLFTNAKISPVKLQQLVVSAVNSTFNRISIDTDTSTSDTVMMFATGEKELTPSEEDILFYAARAMCLKLARDISTTGEGVFKGLEVVARTDFSPIDTAKIAKKIVNSPLVKSAVHGADPNWGRIGAALGKPDPVSVEPLIDMNQLTISIQGTVVFTKGSAVDFDEKKLNQELIAAKLTLIEVIHGSGRNVARAWGSDLSEEYVTFNADYTT
ncbi:MAG: bifunctional ornithine acetyltransferase/N-acetylglutamate synthase [Deltaproteobacteria bacterium]|nr:bifunctional ornithine acetyltransferase/N-acetylglutamate synthase [Deltaproteobacteria bacterium]